MKNIILTATLMALTAATMAADPKIVVPGDRGSTGQVVYPNTIQPGREQGTNRTGLFTNTPPMAGVTNASGIVTNGSATSTNQPGVTNSPQLNLPKP